MSRAGLRVLVRVRVVVHAPVAVSVKDTVTVAVTVTVTVYVLVWVPGAVAVTFRLSVSRMWVIETFMETIPAVLSSGLCSRVQYLRLGCG